MLTCQRHLQTVETGLLDESVGELPAEYVSGEQIYCRNQVDKSLVQPDVGDVGGLDLSHSCK